jgi:hypothetical protein
MPTTGENQFRDLKQNLISLLKDSIVFKTLPEKRSEFEDVVNSLEYSQKSEKLVKEIIKFFEGERDIAAQASELFRKGNPSQAE